MRKTKSQAPMMVRSAGAKRASTVRHSSDARLLAFYLSRDRSLALLDSKGAAVHIVGALQPQDRPSAALAAAVSSYVIDAIASGNVKTLQQLAVEEGSLKRGTPFIYNGHFYGKGFGYNNKTTALTLTECLDGPLSGVKLTFEFSKNGLVNDTAYARMSGSTRLFAFGYIADVTKQSIRAVPYAIGDLVQQSSPMFSPFSPTLELQPDQIDQFASADLTWTPTTKEFKRLESFPERTIKILICELLGEQAIPADWGGEECDIFSANLTVDGTRQTGAFLLKGPAAFHPMTLKDCGKNGDQIYRLFNIPAQIYIVQHCHNIGAAVRKTVEAFALGRSFISPCRYVVMDGITTARLLRANGLWSTSSK